MLHGASPDEAASARGLIAIQLYPTQTFYRVKKNHETSGSQRGGSPLAASPSGGESGSPSQVPQRIPKQQWNDISPRKKISSPTQYPALFTSPVPVPHTGWGTGGYISGNTVWPKCLMFVSGTRRRDTSRYVPEHCMPYLRIYSLVL